jgi:hypothetical protein
MSSLKASFDELLIRIRHGRELGHASFEPVYYLIFSPREIIDVKRVLPSWSARLRNEGWDVHRFSMAEQITDLLEQAPTRKIWLQMDRKAPLAWDKTNQALANALTNGALQERLAAFLDQVAGQTNAIVLVTDLEALHPYLRIGTIEGQLAGEFHVPTIFLYPGVRTGKTKLSFLGFYPEDGNYRSVHIGG